MPYQYHSKVLVKLVTDERFKVSDSVHQLSSALVAHILDLEISHVPILRPPALQAQCADLPLRAVVSGFSRIRLPGGLSMWFAKARFSS